VTEDPAFWSRIANDTRYSRDHRRACILELFRRHVKPRAKLKDVANVLDNPSWLAKEQIHFFGPLAGFVPVTLTFDDSVFSIVILSEPNGDASAVYLRIKGKLTEDELFEQLINPVIAGDPNKALANRRVLEMAIADGRWTIDPIATTDEERFNLVRIGMTRTQVERMLGPPRLHFSREVYYGRVPQIEPWQSPAAPRSISITYSSEDVIIDKRFYRDQTTRRPRR
jgi:hypothetical protein